MISGSIDKTQPIGELSEDEENLIRAHRQGIGILCHAEVSPSAHCAWAEDGRLHITAENLFSADSR